MVDSLAVLSLSGRKFPDCLLRLVVLTALGLAGPLLALPPLLSPSTSWEKVPVGEPDSQSVVTGFMAASEDLLVVMPTGGKLALIDAHTGAQLRLVPKPADMDSGFRFAMSAGFVGNRLMTVSIGFLAVRLDELDTTTGTWGRSASWPTPYFDDVEAPILFDGEIRFQSTDRNINRCSAEDLSPLPSLSIGGYEVTGSSLACTVGDSYLTGYVNSALRIEKPGGERLTLPLPRKYSFSGSVKFSCSPSYLVASEWEYAFIWDARNLSLPPRVMRINDGGGSSVAIWKDRYLLINETNYWGESSIWIRDLSLPELKPCQITLPRTATSAKVHASEGNLWYADGTLGRLAIGDTPQINIVTLTGARANERDGTLKFKIKATPAPLLPVTVELATAAGSATENEDYRGWSGTVTLTSAAPSAEVSIRILPDWKLENYETMTLKVKSVSNGLCFSPEAIGVIVGTGVAETTKTDPLPGGDQYAFISWTDTGLVAREQSGNKMYYCADGQRSWKLITAIPDNIQEQAPYSAPFNNRVAIDENLYLIQPGKNGNPENRIELRRYADASLVRELSLPFDIGSRITLLGGRDGISLIRGGGGTYFHQLTDGGEDTYRFGPMNGQLLAQYSGNLSVTKEYPESMELWDTATPAKLDQVAEKWTSGGAHVAANTKIPLAAGIDNDGAIHEFSLVPKVPVPLKRIFKGSEDAPGIPFDVDFSELVDFRVTVSVAWCSSPADIRIPAAPTILAPGQRKLTLPFTLEDDHVAESDEIVRVGISVSGNGATQVFDVEVSVKDNDIVEFDEKIPNADLVLSSAMDLGQGSPIFGFAATRTVADPVTQELYQPEPERDGEIFAHAVAGTPKYAVIGSPGTKGTAHNSFYILDRIKKSVTQRVTRPGINTGFGSVLHLRNDRVFVGAPGDSAVGSVYTYEIPSGKFLREFSQPGKRQVGTRYGLSIASAGKSVWIGAPREGNGVVYQFDADTGKLIKKFKAPSASASNFGHSLAICGDYVAVGAPSRNAASAVFIYKSSTGSPAGIIPSPFKEGGCFGTSLAGMGQARLAIGCPDRPGSYFGAVMIHNLDAKAFPLVVMLTPSNASNKYHDERYGSVGKTGSLSASGDFLGIQLDRVSDSLTAYNGRRPRGLYSAVVYVAPVVKRKAAAKVAVASRQNPYIIPSTLSIWQPDSTVDPPGLTVTCSGSEVTISLPSLDVAGGSLPMILEASEDLATWTDIATTGSTQQWTSLKADAVIDPEYKGIKLRTTPSGRCYFRLRMERPTP